MTGKKEMTILPKNFSTDSDLISGIIIFGFGGLHEKGCTIMNEDVLLVDASGLKCPLPVLKARKALQGLEVGSKIRVVSTDPASPLDFKHFCATKGHVLIAVDEDHDKFEFTIQKASD